MQSLLALYNKEQQNNKQLLGQLNAQVDTIVRLQEKCNSLISAYEALNGQLQTLSAQKNFFAARLNA